MSAGPATPRLTHVDSTGRIAMVDVGDKPLGDRRARAMCTIRMAPEVARMVSDGTSAKGDVIAASRIAGIQAAKQTASLIPLAHQVPLSHVDVQIDVDVDRGEAAISTQVRTVAGTGVEIEALTAASIAAVTFYDMIKAADRSAVISGLRVVAKSGGRSGDLLLSADTDVLEHVGDAGGQR